MVDEENKVLRLNISGGQRAVKISHGKSTMVDRIPNTRNYEVLNRNRSIESCHAIFLEGAQREGARVRD